MTLYVLISQSTLSLNLSVHRHWTHRMIGAVLVLTVLFLFLLPLFPLIIVTLSFLVFLLVRFSWLFTRRQILCDAVIVLVLLIFLFVLPGWGGVEDSVFFGKLEIKYHKQLQ